MGEDHLVLEPAAQLPNVAFYYPGPIWRGTDYIKNLLLFFDGVALLVPEYMRERPFQLDPAITSGLEQEGLLHILEPESLLDRAATETLATQLVNVIASGALDDLAALDARPYEELSQSRMGSRADNGLFKMLVEELEKRELARPSEDGVSIPMHPCVRNLVLVLLAQILRPAGTTVGLDLCPATDVPSVHLGLSQLLGMETMPTAASVVDLDLQVVGVDLASAPLADVLAFRDKHAEAYRAYARDVRRFMRELSKLPEAERDAAQSDRSAELADKALALQAASRAWWKRPAGVVLGLAGAAWTVTTGDLVGGLLAGGAGLAAAFPEDAPNAEAFSYLFQATQTAWY
jgi:hypothetical protein